jgi:deoxyribose-phosphate aldolase
MNDVEAAKKILTMLDLTSLGDNDKEEDIKKLCKKAKTKYGSVAAVCVWSKFVPLVKELIGDNPINIATVVNFPKGESDIPTVIDETVKAIENGVNEIDLVFPYKEFMKGNINFCSEMISSIKKLCGKKHHLKVILETGEIKKSIYISEATKIAINSGADFIKTSTGKTKISATPEAANIILDTIRAMKKNVGFKASGGIKTTIEAKKYLSLSQHIMGSKWASNRNLRYGASSLLDDLIETIERGY